MEPTSPLKEKSTRWETRVKLHNKKGLHVRAAGVFALCAKQFLSEIRIEHGQNVVDGKSMLSLMKLQVPEDATLKIIATGPDAVEAIAELQKLVRNKFGEPE